MTAPRPHSPATPDPWFDSTVSRPQPPSPCLPLHCCPQRQACLTSARSAPQPACALNFGLHSPRHACFPSSRTESGRGRGCLGNCQTEQHKGRQVHTGEGAGIPGSPEGGALSSSQEGRAGARLLTCPPPITC